MSLSLFLTHVPAAKETLFSFISSLGITKRIAFLFTLWLEIYMTVSDAPP